MITTRQERANYSAAYFARFVTNTREVLVNELRQLGDTPNPDAVDALIQEHCGSRNWTQLRCDHCGKYSDAVAAVGGADLYAGADLCLGCLESAVAELRKVDE